MDVLSVIWLIGEVFALVVLGGGAVLSLFESQFVTNLMTRSQRPSPPQFHLPYNHRLVGLSDPNADW